MFKPLVEIHRVAPDAYSYRVSVRGSAAQHDGAAFASLATCLHDAGALLGPYFAGVEVDYEGTFVGICTTHLLRENPRGVAERIERQLLPA